MPPDRRSRNPTGSHCYGQTCWLLPIAILFASVWLATLGGRKLLNPDEGRYAEIPREMLATGDWLTPRLNDLKYFEKPPLQYWATAVAFETLGTTEFAARLWCGLTGLAGIFLIAWLGGRLFGRNAGIAAAALLACSLMYFVLGQLNTLDMGLTFFLTLAIGGFLLAQQAPPQSKAERNFMLLAWAAAALALLSKGIVALALPAMALIVYTAIEREYSAWKRLHVIPGLALFLLIGAPWFVAASIANPEFPRFFFVHEHLARFLTDVHERVEPWWYFVPLSIAGALPWTSLAAVAMAKAWRTNSATRQSAFNARRFLVIWIATVLLFFSASHSKLAPYILPIFPALALLTGDYVARATNRVIRNHVLGIAVLWALALGYLILGPLPHRHEIPPEAIARVFHWTLTGAAIALASTVLAWALAGRGRIREAILIMSGGTFLALTLLLIQFDAARTIRSGYDLAEQIKPYHSTGKPFYSIGSYDHSLNFYLADNATLVDYKNELEFGQQQEPAKSLTHLEDFKHAWARDPPGSLAVANPQAFAELQRAGIPLTVIGGNLRMIAVKKP